MVIFSRVLATSAVVSAPVFRILPQVTGIGRLGNYDPRCTSGPGRRSNAPRSAPRRHERARPGPLQGHACRQVESRWLQWLPES